MVEIVKLHQDLGKICPIPPLPEILVGTCHHHLDGNHLPTLMHWQTQRGTPGWILIIISLTFLVRMTQFLPDRDPRKVPLCNSYKYSSRRSSDYTSVYSLGSEESHLTSENNIDEENYLLSKLQTLYNSREYVLSLKADHPLVNKTNKTIQEIEARLNDLYENRFPKNELESITDPIGLQKERFRRRERRAKRAQWEEQINPNQMARNHECREDYRQDEIDRAKQQSKTKQKRQREMELERQKQFENWKTDVTDSYLTGIQKGIPPPPNNMTRAQQIEADEMLARAIYEQEKATVALADKKTKSQAEEIQKQTDLRQAIDNMERARMARQEVRENLDNMQVSKDRETRARLEQERLLKVIEDRENFETTNTDKEMKPRHCQPKKEPSESLEFDPSYKSRDQQGARNIVQSTLYDDKLILM